MLIPNRDLILANLRRVLAEQPNLTDSERRSLRASVRRRLRRST